MVYQYWMNIFWKEEAIVDKKQNKKHPNYGKFPISTV